MIDERLETIENRLKKLEKDREHMIDHIQELQLVIEKLQPVSSPTQEYQQPANSKIEYLTAANEQMFQQNQRLREYIERCISGETTLDQKGYLRALSGE
jgi:FtsZ-binding cell division protein ZapB